MINRTAALASAAGILAGGMAKPAGAHDGVLPLIPKTDLLLRARAQPIEMINDYITDLFMGMARTLVHWNALGIAAPQVGYSLRMIVVRRGNNLIAMANPEITAATQVMIQRDEMCLSLPGVKHQVWRANQVRVKFMAHDGGTMEIRAQGMDAICVQHEIDHLEGRLMTDYSA